jgi:glycosyltransferase involved in cell wall biosynthesis
VSARPVAVVTSGFPRLSETFALNELLALEDRGMLAGIFATKRGDDAPPQPDVKRLAHRVEILESGSPYEQGRRVAASLERRRVAGIHAYFAHAPAEVAEQAARTLRVPFGFSVHARDARKVAPAILARRAAQAACVVACNPDVAGELTRTGARAHILPHGVDLRRFAPTPEPAADTLRLLAVGRLVEKKGFGILINAVALLGERVLLRIVGDGPLRRALTTQAGALGLQDRVTLVPAVTHADLPDEYAAAHVVIVPSVVDSSGDRDGLPNVVLEAMASGRAIVGSRAGAIAAAIRDAETGLLVTSRSSTALAEAITSLSASAERRQALGARARRAVERDYDVQRCAGAFADLLGGAYA